MSTPNSSNFDDSHDQDGLLDGVYSGYNHQFAKGAVLCVEVKLACDNFEENEHAMCDSGYSIMTTIDMNDSTRLRF